MTTFDFNESSEATGQNAFLQSVHFIALGADTDEFGILVTCSECSRECTYGSNQIGAYCVGALPSV